jgi:membrane associated rhomboid family serine protease
VTRWVLVLIVANVVFFLLTTINPVVGHQLAYVPSLVLEQPWGIVTYMFIHGDFSHILFNMLGLFFFGPRLEMYIGEKRFLWLYALSGLSGALLSTLFSPNVAIIGASGAVYGVFLGFAYFWPKELIYIWGVFPVQARWMVVGFTMLSLYGGLGASRDGIAHFAHLGGYLGAYLYLRFAVGPDGQSRERRQKPVRISQSDLDRWNAIDRNALHEVNRDELDRIRMKLVNDKDATLTETERMFLERFSGGKT